MQKIEQQYLTGERALFHARDKSIYFSTFAEGESPLKESRNIELYNTMFKWKYPLWYSKDIKVENCYFFDMARAAIWYTDNISMVDCTIEAPKIFRRTTNIDLKNVTMVNAEETLWNCNGIKMSNVKAKGNYFAMNSENIEIEGFELVGNYSFDGCRNVVVRNAKMLSKDAFWNCDNVTVYDSFISGEYIGWNAKNVTFVNCTIESEQGLCYMENLVMENCRLLNTNLAFEYSTVKAEIKGTIDSVLNPTCGTIYAEKIDKVILEEDRINPKCTEIKTGGLENAV